MSKDLALEQTARNAVCHKCEKRGYFSAQCFTKPTLSQVEAKEGPMLDGMCFDTGEGYLDTLATAEKLMYWTAGVLMGAQEVQFKLDTETDVTAISEEVHKRLNGATVQVFHDAVLSQSYSTGSAGPVRAGRNI